MGFFNSTKTPNTVSDKTMASLSRRAQKAAPPLFSPESIKHRQDSNAQRSKAKSS